MMRTPLLPRDFDTDTWVRLKEHLDGRLALLRERNDGDHGPEATAKLRGRIDEIKDLLALDQPAPAQDPAPSVDD